MNIKGLNVAKWVQRQGMRVLAKPEMFARDHDNGVDELRNLGGVAGLYGRNSPPDVSGRTSRQFFVPPTFGRGLGHAVQAEGGRS